MSQRTKPFVFLKTIKFETCYAEAGIFENRTAGIEWQRISEGTPEYVLKINRRATGCFSRSGSIFIEGKTWKFWINMS